MKNSTHTLLDILKLSTEYLTKNNLQNPRLDAELLISGYLNLKRLDLYLKFDKPILETELAEIRNMLKKRAKSEPIQYILGKVDFFGYQFIVNRSVLIPRLDTEILIESILDKIGIEDKTILDIGTGSGCIPISLILESKNKDISATGLDISEEALEIAKQNADLHNLTVEKMKFVKRDIFSSGIKVKEKFDIVVSNPPYIKIEEYNKLDTEVIEFEPSIALTDNSNDGLNFYRRLAELLPTILKPNKYFFAEIGFNQAKEVKEIFSSVLNNIEIIKDLTDNDRVILGLLD